jgi:hypothetical protein
MSLTSHVVIPGRTRKPLVDKNGKNTSAHYKDQSEADFGVLSFGPEDAGHQVEASLQTAVRETKSAPLTSPKLIQIEDNLTSFQTDLQKLEASRFSTTPKNQANISNLKWTISEMERQRSQHLRDLHSPGLERPWADLVNLIEQPSMELPVAELLAEHRDERVVRALASSVHRELLDPRYRQKLEEHRDETVRVNYFKNNSSIRQNVLTRAADSKDYATAGAAQSEMSRRKKLGNWESNEDAFRRRQAELARSTNDLA